MTTTTKEENDKLQKLLLTGNNWKAFDFKFKLKATTASLWDAIDPTQDPKVTRHTTQTKMKALEFLINYVHDDLIWIITSCHDPSDPRICYQALKAELGTTRKDPKAEIKRLNQTKLSGRNTESYFKTISSGINDLRQLGVTKEQFGEREHCDVLISGLTSEFEMLQTTLYTEFDRTNWDEEVNDTMNPESIMKSIELYKSRLPASAPRSNRRERPETRNPSNWNNRQMNNSNPRPAAQTAATPCSFCIAMGGFAATKAQTHLLEDCGFKKRADRANAALHAAATQGNKPSSSSYLILDSGATKHMHNDHKALFDYTPFKEPKNVILGDNNCIKALGKGTMILESLVDGKVSYVPFFNTIHVPNLANGLISVPVLMRSNTKTDWNSNDTVTVYHQRSPVMIAKLLPNNQLQIQGTPLNDDKEHHSLLDKLKLDYASVASYSTAAPNEFLRWHRRLGHPSTPTLIKTQPIVTGMNLGKDRSMPSCEPCDVANATRAKHKTSPSKETTPGTLLHADHGLFTVPTINGEKGYLLVGDDSDHWIDLELVSSFSAPTTLSAFKKIVARSQTQLGRKVTSLQRLRTDEHGAFEGVFQKYLEKNGIHHELTIRYEHEQAGWIERMNQTIGRKNRANMTFAKVPIELAGYSLSYAAYCTNRTFTTTENMTPYEKRNGVKPDVSHLRIFYCPAIVTIPKELQRKDLPQHGVRCRYLGPSANHRGDVFIEVATHRIITSNAARFHEDWFENPTFPHRDYAITFDEPFDHDSEYVPTQDQAETFERPTDVQDQAETFERLIDVDLPSVPTTQPPNAPIPKHTFKFDKDRKVWIANPALTWWDPMTRDGNDDPFDFDSYHAFQSTVQHDVPQTLGEAKKHPEWHHYRQAMITELTAHKVNNTWKRLPRSKFLNQRRIRCKWVFAKKLNHDGSINKYKARLVALGFAQRHGIDYTETFAPTLALKAFRTLVAVAAAHGYKLYHADVPTAFVRSELHDDVFMAPPPIPDDLQRLLPPDLADFSDTDILKLLKSLYGLKQAPREWYATLREFLLSIGFLQSKTDPCIFVYSKNSDYMAIGIYVDDLLYFGTPNLVEMVMKQLQDRFNITMLGLATWFLGIHIDQSDPNGAISLDQTKYITDFLDSLNVSSYPPVSTPLLPNYPALLKTSPTPFTIPLPMTYNQILGKLMYAMVGTRPDLCAAVGILSRYLHDPQRVHWDMIIRVLQYLNGTTTLGITYTPDATRTAIENATPIAWSDADFAQDPEKARSTSGIIIKICNGPIVWHSKKQSTTAQSTAEAEYIALNVCSRMVVWVRQFLSCLGFPCTQPTLVHEDNLSAISISNNPQVNEKTAHIQVKFHYVHEKILDHTIRLQACPTTEMLADICTKGLPGTQFRHLCKRIGLTDLGGECYANAQGFTMRGSFCRPFVPPYTSSLSGHTSLL